MHGLVESNSTWNAFSIRFRGSRASLVVIEAKKVNMDASTMDGRVNRKCSHNSEIPAIFKRMKCKSQFLARTGGLSLLSAHGVLLFNCLIIIALSREAYVYMLRARRERICILGHRTRDRIDSSLSLPQKEISPPIHMQCNCFVSDEHFYSRVRSTNFLSQTPIYTVNTPYHYYPRIESKQQQQKRVQTKSECVFFLSFVLLLSIFQC